MRKRLIIIISSIIAIIAIALAIILPLTLNNGGYRSIKAHEIVGDVSVIRDNKKMECYKDMALKNNDRIEVLASSSLIMKLDSDKFVRLEENSSLELYSSDDLKKTLLRLNEGGCLIELKNKLEGEFLVEAPNSSMAIRGTVVYVMVKKSPGKTYVEYSLAEGMVELSTYLAYDDNKYKIISSNLNKDRSLSLEILDKDLLAPGRVHEIDELYKKNDEGVDKESLNNIDDLVSLANRLNPRAKGISDSVNKKIYEGLDKFKDTKYSLSTINASFSVIGANIENQISYEAIEPFEVEIRANDIENKAFKAFKLNGNAIMASYDNTLKIKVDGNLVIEAIYDLEDRIKISMINATINGLNEAFINKGERVAIDVDNPNGYGIEKILVNSEEMKPDTRLDIVLNEDTTVEFVLNEKNRMISLDGAYIEGYENQKIASIPLGMEIIAKSIDPRPAKEFIINDEVIKSDYDFISLRVNKALRVKCNNMDCAIDETILSYEGFKVDNLVDFKSGGTLKRGTRVILTVNKSDDLLLDYYLYNGKRLDTKKSTITLDMNERANIKAVFKERIKYNVSIENGNITTRDLSDVKACELYLDEDFLIEVINPDGLNVLGIIVNNEPIYNVGSSVYLNCSGDMRIKFILENSDRKISLYTDTIAGGTVMMDGVMIEEGVELIRKPGESIRLEAISKPGYRFEGFWNKPYGEENRYLINPNSTMSYIVSSSGSVYASFKEIREAYIVKDIGHVLELNQSINQVFPEEMPDIDFNNLKLFAFDSKSEEYVRCNDNDYKINVTYSTPMAITQPDFTPMPIELDDITTNKSGIYTLEFLSLNSENSHVEPLAAIAIFISDKVNKPEKFGSLSFLGEEVEIIPNNSYGKILSIMDMGMNNFDITTKSLMIGVNKTQNGKAIYINEGLFNEPLIEERNGARYIKFKYNILDDYKLYAIDMNNEIFIEYVNDQELLLDGNNSLLLGVIPKAYDMSKGITDVGMFITSSMLQISFINDPLMISVGENRFKSLDGYRCRDIKNIAVLSQANNIVDPNPDDTTGYYSLPRISINLNVGENSMLDSLYHNSNNELELRVKAGADIANIRLLDDTAINLDEDGIYSFNLKPSYKIYESYQEEGYRYSYTIEAAGLIYSFKINIKGEDYIIDLNYLVATENIRQMIYDALYNNDIKLAYDFKETNESLGYDKNLYEYYFKEGSEGFSLPTPPPLKA